MLAINGLFKLPKGELLLPDAPELIEKVLTSLLAMLRLALCGCRRVAAGHNPYANYLHDCGPCKRTMARAGSGSLSTELGGQGEALWPSLIVLMHGNWSLRQTRCRVSRWDVHRSCTSYIWEELHM